MLNFLFGRSNKPRAKKAVKKCVHRRKVRHPAIAPSSPDGMWSCAEPGYKAVPGHYCEDPWYCRAPTSGPGCPRGKWMDPWGSGRCVKRSTAERRSAHPEKNPKNIQEDVSMSGDEDMGAYSNEAGISMFGKRIRRFKNTASPCYMPKLNRSGCKNMPGCVYVRSRGCRSGPIKRTMPGMPEGPLDTSAGDEAIRMGGELDFGKRIRRRRHATKGKKIPKAILKMCKKYHIKTTVKHGKKRVPRPLKVLKRLIAKKKKMEKPARRSMKMNKMHFGTHEMNKIHFGEMVAPMKTHEMLISAVNKIPGMFFPLTRKNRVLAKLPSAIKMGLFNFIPADGGITKVMLIDRIKKANDMHSMATKFGKKRRISKKNKKPSRAILKMCKKYRIKTTKMSGKKRIYKSLTVLKRLIAKKKKMLKR